ncbi:right-handed parallel beta-helix repeat-containing protein, partial [Paenarthrobacter nitroguajacolicus]|uniref:right-handed parallel beta-helix repeat-containing protein n=1 Tax=Paenarthrobacter nitroguajacolicus TaxID=211146 RepID=UPI003ADD3E49
NATYARAGLGGLVLDATAGPYNAKGDGATDDYTAIDNAAVALETFGGGTLLLPKGVYRTSAYLRPRNYVRYQGAGIGRTVIKPYQSAAFTGHGTLAAPIESPSWFDMTWDGSSIPGTNSLKGQFSEYLRNAHWERVECKNFTATGFGSDFLPGGRYINCIASGNGRGQAVHDPGMSGFGIGTGKYDVEDVLVQGCIAFGNTNYGIFVEKQGGVANTPYYSKGVRIVNNYTYGNAWGIGGCGVDSPVYSGNVCSNNSYDGITLHEGTGLAPLGQPDKKAIVTGNQCYSNGRDGINIDYEKNSLAANQAYHVISSNNCYSNTRDGFRLVGAKWASDVVRGIKVIGNKFSRNGGEGINVVSATGAEAGAYIADLHIEDNDVNANALNGIRLSENLTRPVVRGNTCFDDQATRTQVYGILTDAGHTITDGTVQGNTLVQNKTDGMSPLATWAGYTLVTGNKGYYPGWNNVTGTSPLTYTCGVTPETLYFTGSVTDVQFKPRAAGGFITMGTGGTGTHSFPLEPGDQVQITYTGATPSNGKSIKRQ